MKYCWLYQYLFIQCLTLQVSQSFYSINAPGVIKPNRKYSVVVTLHEANGPCSIRVGIEGPAYNAVQDVNLMPFESKLVAFLPKNLLNGNYKLTAEGLSGLRFKNESKITLESVNSPKIYIQTDKAIYKPKDLVQFRIVILDEHTRPLHIKDPVHVEILDNQDNVVKLFRDIALVKGVYTGKFKLSEYPALGWWKIKAILSGDYDYSILKTITVQEYILPKFSVYLKTPSNFLLEDGYIKAVVFGKYTFDKYVEGNATVELRAANNNLLLQRQQFDIEKLGFVEFHLKNLKNIENLYGLMIVANITEKHTGITETEKKYVNIQKQRYNIQIPYDGIEFKNNIPYRLKANVKFWTGAVVLDRKTPIIMNHGNESYEAYLDEYGTATLEFNHSAEANHEFQYKDSKISYPNIYVRRNLKTDNTEYYCRLRLVEERSKLGKPVVIEVSSVDDIPYLKYIMVGHASLIRMEHIEVPPNKKSHNISITPSIEMVPQSYIYVYYVHKGILRYEEMTLRFPNEFENKISLTAPKQVRPGEKVTIGINAQPKSYVSILAVDLGVYLLDSSYDLYPGNIISGLQSEQSYIPIAAIMYPGLVSGLITLTDAHYTFLLANVGGGGFGYGGGTLPASLRFRQKFPETWIFQNLEINDTNTQLTLQIPDSVTTWLITAFSNNDVTGFGIVDRPTGITTIQPFFISLNLPYSVKLGEIVIIPVTIFNYLNQSVNTEVVLYNKEQDFYFLESKRQGIVRSNDGQKKSQHVNIPSEKAKTVEFIIYPVKVGEVNLSISASSSLYSDAVVQKLKVEPDGVAKQQSKTLYISIPADEKLSLGLNVDIPQDIVAESELITFSAGGDFLVPSLEKFDEFIQMPTGSGDQNMVNFVPNVLILQYLKANGSWDNNKELVEKLHSDADIAYQQQLSFRHSNGGFSMFGGNIDEEASTWLTAYVVRYFIKASEITFIEPRVIETGLDFLAKQQKSNGEFPFTGYLSNPAQTNQFGFTAFVMLAFLEDQKYAMKYKTTIRKSLEFLESNLNNVQDVYALAMMATALKLARIKNANILIDKLQSYRKEANGLIWWSENNEDDASDIEITAYVAMAVLDTPGDHTPILKWLIEQHNGNSFTTTLDAVVGLEALVKFSQKYKNVDNVDLRLTYSAKDQEETEVVTGELFVDSTNNSYLQKYELPKHIRHIDFDMEGMGTSLVQLSYKYNTLSEDGFRHFVINPKANFQNSKELNLEICFICRSESNMVIMEVNLPSGFKSNAEYSSALTDNDRIQRIQLKNAESTIILYLGNVGENARHCLDILADKTNDVLATKPAAIIMYDYYNLKRSNIKFYSL